MTYYWRDTMPTEIKIPQSSEYKSWIKELKQKLRKSQIKAAINVNSVLLEFYWELGIDIVEKQKRSSWGSGFLKQLSKDLMDEFPDMKGFSYRNIKYIRQWYLFYVKRQQVVALLTQIPWGHNIFIVTKCDTVEEAEFYICKTKH